MKLRKYLALFLAAALMVSVLPQRGSAASVSEMMEDAETEESDVLAEAENPDSEPGGNTGSVNKTETADEQDMVDNHETPDGQETVNEQETLDNPEEEGHKDLESTEAPEEPEMGETAEKAESEQTDQEASTDAAITETDAPLEDTVSDETEKTEDITADSEKTENAEDTEVQEEDGAQKPTESEMSNEMLTANPENELETQEGDIASGVDGNITWRIDADGKLTVNGTGDVSNKYNWPWGSYKNSIVSAEINITGMTDTANMFLDCSSLSSLDLSSFDTTNVTSMRYMFLGCSNLSSLDLSSFDTTNVTDMYGMFSCCSNLSSLDLSSFDTKKVTWMDEMFYGCSSLSSLDLSNFDTTKVTGMDEMFYGCSILSSLDLSSFDTTNVTGMRYMFSDCSSLSSLNLSSFDTINVTGMTNMFSGCSSLSSLNLSSFDTAKVTGMMYMFRGCSSLSNLDLSSFDTTEVTDMRYMFRDCSSLSSLDLSSFNTRNVTRMDEMFWRCSSLSSLDLSSFDTTKVMNMSVMFSGCENLECLDLSSFNTINVTRMDDMFSYCNSLSSLDLGSFDTTKVMNMSFMFSGCENLESLDLSSFNTINVTRMDDMFWECTSMTSIHTPRNVNVSVELPFVSDGCWLLPDGTEITELPQNLDHSVMITRRRNPKIITTTPDLNMDDVIRVKYVPYSYTVKTDNWDENNKVTFSIEKGELAEGLQIYPETGEIYGVPLETGEFPITVKASYSNPEYLPSYADLTLTVIDNTDNNVLNASDAGYEVEQHIGSQMYDSADTFSYVVTESADQLFISAGAYSEFMDFWLNGRKLVEGEDYTKESGSTRITIRKQTFEEKADQNGTNTIAAEFRVGGKPENALKRTAQNFRMDLQSENNNEEHHSGSGSRGRGGDSGGSSSGSGTAGGSYATSVIRLVDASGNPLPDTILELHSTPQEARTDQNGIAVFAEVENGVHTLYAKNGNGTIFALKSFELLFGENTGIMNDQITVKAGTAFTLNVQVDGNELKFLNLQEGDLYQVVSAATSDDTRPAIWFLLAVLSAGTISGGILYRRRKQYAGSMQ